VLSVAVDGAEVATAAAVPTLRFRTRITAADTRPVRSVTLNVQVRIAAAERTYDAATQQRLVELFGLPAEWARSLRDLLWTTAVVQVPAFQGHTVVDVPVPCTYDFDVVATKYLHAVRDGEIPLEFLFSGTVFYTAGDLLQAAQLPWDTTARYRMPAARWRELMDTYFPHSAWVRLDRTTFDQLYAYRARHTLTTWDEAVTALLRAAGHDGGGEHDTQ